MRQVPCLGRPMLSEATVQISESHDHIPQLARQWAFVCVLNFDELTTFKNWGNFQQNPGFKKI